MAFFKIACFYCLQKDSENLDTLIISKQNPTAVNKNGGRNYIEKGKIVDLWLVRPNPVIDRFRKRRIKNCFIKQNLNPADFCKQGFAAFHPKK